jgi:hypothetical protein
MPAPPMNCSPGSADAGMPSIVAVQPVHVATWIEAGTGELAAPSVKQRLAVIVTCSIGSSPARSCRFNPAGSVRGPRHVVTSGQTPVLDAAEAAGEIGGIEHAAFQGGKAVHMVECCCRSWASLVAGPSRVIPTSPTPMASRRETYQKAGGHILGICATFGAV